MNISNWQGGWLSTTHLPWVLIVQPWIGSFQLVTLGRNELLEDTILVPQSITPDGEFLEALDA